MNNSCKKNESKLKCESRLLKQSIQRAHNDPSLYKKLRKRLKQTSFAIKLEKSINNENNINIINRELEPTVRDSEKEGYISEEQGRYLQSKIYKKLGY